MKELLRTRPGPFGMQVAEPGSVIPGMRNPAHVAGNTAASDAGPLPAAILEKIHRHRWVRNYYD